MSELQSEFDLDGCRPAQSSLAGAAIWPPPMEDRIGHKFAQGTLTVRRTLPLFCNPLVIFLFNWVIMLAALSVHVTYVSYPNMGLPILLCMLSVSSFVLGYVVARTALRRWSIGNLSLSYTLDVTNLVRLNLIFCCISVVIIAFNWITLGPPPALGDPTSYLTYGRFRQVLFPLLVTVSVNATLDPSRWRKIVFALFGIAGLAIYVTRGLLMVALLQMFFVFALRTRMSRRRLYAIAFGCLALAIAAITLIGNARTAQDIFLEYLQIRQQYSHWPMAYLWLTSYISIPFSNLCWVLARGSFHGPTLSFLYPLLPSFLMPPNPHAAIHNDLTIIDGASTYLFAYALDFSYVGVYLANLVLGLGCGWLVERAMPRQILVAAIFLTCLSFIFFSDMFTPLSTILQVLIQMSVQKKCFLWGESATNALTG